MHRATSAGYGGAIYLPALTMLMEVLGPVMSRTTFCRARIIRFGTRSSVCRVRPSNLKVFVRKQRSTEYQEKVREKKDVSGMAEGATLHVTPLILKSFVPVHNVTGVTEGATPAQTKTVWMISATPKTTTQLVIMMVVLAAEKMREQISAAMIALRLRMLSGMTNLDLATTAP